MKIRIEGVMNPCTFLGCSFEERAGFQRIDVKVDADFEDADDGQIAEWLKETFPLQMSPRKISRQDRPNAFSSETPVSSAIARLNDVMRQSESTVNTPHPMVSRMMSWAFSGRFLCFMASTENFPFQRLL
jgi:hypothetical protein